MLLVSRTGRRLPLGRADPIARHDAVEDRVELVVARPVAGRARDQDELKKANRATLAEWTLKHGTENQRERMAAGLLPWNEIYAAAEEYLLFSVFEFSDKLSIDLVQD